MSSYATVSVAPLSFNEKKLCVYHFSTAELFTYSQRSEQLNLNQSVFGSLTGKGIMENKDISLQLFTTHLGFDKLLYVLSLHSFLSFLNLISFLFSDCPSRLFSFCSFQLSLSFSCALLFKARQKQLVHAW